MDGRLIFHSNKIKIWGFVINGETGLKKDHMNCFVHEIYAIVTFILN